MLQLVATSSLLLACKLEEDPRRVRSLIDIVQLLAKAEDANTQITQDNIDQFLIDHDSPVHQRMLLLLPLQPLLLLLAPLS